MSIAKEIASLPRMGVPALRMKYAELFGEATSARNKAWLVKRIAWRMQALAEGDLSERARQRALELANDADVRMSPPKDILPLKPAPAERTKTMTLRLKGDQRLPPPGSVITRMYKGQTFNVMILADGFEFEGERYKSLSAVAKTITGQHVNGFSFFQLSREGSK
jgi:hypothetical protein